MAKSGRVYISLDLGFYEEWGFQVSSNAILVWILALSVSKSLRHDGAVPVLQVRRKLPELTTEAFDAALKELHLVPDAPVSVVNGPPKTIVLHGWEEWYNDPFGNKRKGSWGNHVRWHVQTEKPSADCEHCDAQLTLIAKDRTAIPGDSLKEESRLEESRLEDSDSDETSHPQNPSGQRGKERATTASRKQRGTPAPDKFEVTPKMKEWASNQGAIVDELDFETEKFLDHHLSKGNLFTSWDAAWRSWVRNSIKWRKERSAQSPPSKQGGPVTRSRKDVATGDVRAYRSAGQNDLADALQSQIEKGEFD